MSSNVIGEATIVVSADASDFSDQLDEELPKAAERSGGLMSGALGGALKVGGVAAAAGLAGVLGMGLSEGFSRLTSIEQAESKLKGLGHSAESVQTIMDSALASVKGTAYGLGDAASLAANAVAAGVQPGEELTRQLKTMADTATIAGVPLLDMSDIFGDVNAAGRATGETFQRLQERGIPATQMLAKQMGLSMEETREAISNGKVDVNTFIATLEAGFGGAALKSGETLQGAMMNTRAAMGRLGATVLGPIFEKMPAVMEGLIKKFDEAAPAAEKVGEALGNAFAWVSETLVKLKPTLDSIWDRFVWAITLVWNILANQVMPILREVFGWIADHRTMLLDVSLVILSMVAAWKAWTIALTIWQGVQKAVIALQLAFNAAMMTNPVTWIVLAIVGLIAALVLLYNRNEAFREFIQGIWQGIKDFMAPVIAWIKETVPPLWDKVSKSVGDAMSATWTWIKETWDKIGPYVMTALQFLWTAWSTYFKLYWTVVREVMERVWAVLKWVWENIIPIWVKYLQILWTVVSTVFMAIWNVISWVWENVVPLVVTYVQIMWSVITTVFNAVRSVVETVMGVVNTVISTVMTAVMWVWDNVLMRIWAVVSTVFPAVWNVISTVLSAVWTVVSTVFNAIATVVGFVMNIVWTIIRVVWGVIGPFVLGVLTEMWNNVVRIFNFIRSVIEVAMTVIQTIISTVWTAIMWVWENVLVKTWNTVQSTFTLIRSYIEMAMSVIRSVIETILGVVNWVWDNVFLKIWNTTVFVFDLVQGKVSTGLEFIRGLFEAAVTNIGNVWNRVTSVVKEPIRGMFQWINDNMITPINNVLGNFSDSVKFGFLPTNFADGGRVSGPGGPRDDKIPAMLSNGEFVHTAATYSRFGPLIDAIHAAGQGFGIGGPSVEAQILGWLRSQGMGDAGIAAFLGNIQAESGMDPGAIEGGTGEGYGLIQWSFSRKADLMAFAKQRGTSWSDLATQLSFLASELSAYPQMWTQLLSATNPVSASQLLANTFIRPGVYGPRDDYASRFFAAMQAGDLTPSSGMSIIDRVVSGATSIIRSLVEKVSTPALNGLRGMAGDSWAGRTVVGLAEHLVEQVLNWAAEQDALAGAMTVAGAGYDGPGSGFLARPLAGYAVTSEFMGPGRPDHMGIDLGAALGTEVLAAAAGRVMQAGWNGGYGNFVKIDHGAGLATTYGHMQSIAAQAGQIIAQRGLVGLVGSTGDSTGPHLHFEVLQGGQYVNPRSMVQFDEGGWLPTGASMIYNGTGKPEPVLTNEQWNKVKGPTINIVNNYPQAEPTSVTTSRALKMMALVGGSI